MSGDLIATVARGLITVNEARRLVGQTNGVTMEDRLTLPEQVRQRLNLDGPSPGIAVVRGRPGVGKALEEERLNPIEVRQTDDGVFGVEGYALTFDVPYDVAGGAPYGWSETIARGAADLALEERDDVRLLVNHGGVALARTKSGTLTLTADNIGLRSVADELDLRNPTAQELRSAMERGDIDEMSFAFRATKQEWNEDYTERTITELRLFDVSIVTYPANPATHIGIRSDNPVAPIAAMPLGLARADAERLRARRIA